MNGHDGINKAKDRPFTPAGVGMQIGRHCMHGAHHVSQQQGGKFISYRGVKVWCCPACVELRARRVAA